MSPVPATIRSTSSFAQPANLTTSNPTKVTPPSLPVVAASMSSSELVSITVFRGSFIYAAAPLTPMPKVCSSAIMA